MKMVFLDLFKKKTGYNLPDMYKGIVTKDEYNFLSLRKYKFSINKSSFLPNN